MRKIKTAISLILIVSLFFSCLNINNESENQEAVRNDSAKYELVLASEVDWTYLNPARGDKAPMAGTLWGNRKGTKPTGFLLKPKDGFESPPHIHNVSYRGIVISGYFHNDDPSAENMWMSTGSFWTQPKGEVHITASKGTNTLAYIEIEEGPYLVHSADDAFQTDERPVNLDKSNIVWLDASNIKWFNQMGKQASGNEPQIAFLWGNPNKNQLNGTLLKLPSGFSGKIHSRGSSFRAIVIKGQAKYQGANKNNKTLLETGSYFGSRGEATHFISNETGEECIVYIRMEGRYDIN